MEKRRAKKVNYRRFLKNKKMQIAKTKKRTKEDEIRSKRESKFAKMTKEELLRYMFSRRKLPWLSKEILEANPLLDLFLVVKRTNVPHYFPKAVIKQAKSIPQEVREEDLEGRIDLRDQFIFTIDGEDAKDFDDAVSLEIEDNYYVLGVHIADVSHYVKPGTALDEEAYKRGNSTYLIDVVFPMLPFELSNNICSLNPNVDRLTLSVKIWINKNTLEPEKFEIFPSVIRSKYRLTYTYVEKVLDNPSIEKDKDLAENLIKMWELSWKLHEKRIEKGGIDFNFKESKIILDERGNPVEFIVYNRLKSERLIEEFMLMANKVVARFLSEKGPTIFRVHEKPDIESIENIIKVVSLFNYFLPNPEKVKSSDLQKIICNISQKEYEEFINYVILRSMKQARYDTNNVGHYGLDFEYYTHFTSPIRRYPDLILHRLVKLALQNKEKRPKSLTLKKLKQIAKHCSETERRSVDAERLIVKLKGIRYIKNYPHKIFDAIVSGFKEDGMFVQLVDTAIEGFVSIQDITDSVGEVHYDENIMALVDRTGEIKFSIGQSVKVGFKSYDLIKGFLDFYLV